MTVVVAPAEVDLDGPVVFLAGPIQGALSWQDEAIERLSPHVHVASPRRPWDTEAEFSDAMYAEQVDWETRWLRRAGRDGVILFWLARETRHDCARAHAQTTRFELAEWLERARRAEARLVVGVEDGFSGARYIRRRIAQDAPHVPVCGTLAETCAAVLRDQLIGFAGTGREPANAGASSRGPA